MIAYAVSMKYMLAGYTVILAVLALYIISLIVRWMNLKRDIQMLQEIKRTPQKD